MKKILAGCILALALVGCSNDTDETIVNKEGENDQTQTSLTVLEEFNADTVKNKAVLVVDENFNNKMLESKLQNYVDTYDIDIQKVEFTSEIEEQVITQTDEMEQNFTRIKELNGKFQQPAEGEATNEYFTELDTLIQKGLDMLEKEEDITSLSEEIAGKTSASTEEVTEYIEKTRSLIKFYLKEPISKDNLPYLILFNDGELNRIQGFPTDENQLDWLLVNKGLLNLSKEESLKESSTMIEEGKEFVLVFGTSTCPYCQNTSPIVEELTSEMDIEYKYVDINYVNNVKYSQEFMSKDYLSTDITSTPTVVYIKDGKELKRFEGQLSRTEIKDFLEEEQTAKE